MTFSPGETVQIIIDSCASPVDVIIDMIANDQAKVKVKCMNNAVRYINVDKLIKKDQK